MCHYASEIQKQCTVSFEMHQKLSGVWALHGSTEEAYTAPTDTMGRF